MLSTEPISNMLQEKAATAPVVTGRRKPRLSVSTVTAALLALGFWYWASVSTRLIPFGFGSKKCCHTSFVDPDYTDWDTIAPSEKLSWVPCFRFAGNFQCARLTVPRDYSRPLSESPANPKVHLALVMLPGQGHSEESGAFSESPLLLNPGGPGGSGTQFVLGAGPAFQAIAGPDRDVIGFDPRGIGASWPPADCFLPPRDSDEPVPVEERNHALMHRLTWQLGDQSVDLPRVNDSATSLVNLVARARASCKLCEDLGDENSILKYVGTPHVARDMLSIIEAWDDWTSKFMSAEEPRPEPSFPGSQDTAPPSTRGKLVYWGFSYGTLLGATFASMFRMCLPVAICTALVLTYCPQPSLSDVSCWMEWWTATSTSRRHRSGRTPSATQMR